MKLLKIKNTVFESTHLVIQWQSGNPLKGNPLDPGDKNGFSEIRIHSPAQDAIVMDQDYGTFRK